MLYRQLPARSPIPRSVLPKLALQAFAGRGDPRAHLAALLEDRFQADGSILCAKGTHALQLALAAICAAGDRRPVLLPAYSCFEVATAAVGADVPVAFYDIDPDTLEPDWDSLRASAARGASALVVAPLYGMPLDWNIAREIADQLDIPLIEDAAQAHGTSWQGHAVGSFGDMTVLSFGRGKGWTGGGGGALLWRGARAARLAQRIHVVRNGSRSKDAASVVAIAAQWLLARPRLFALPAGVPFLAVGETIYHEPAEPARMNRINAALLLASDCDAAAEVPRRRRNAQSYAHSLNSESDIISPIGHRFNEESGALRFPLRIRDGWRNALRAGMDKYGAAPGYPQALSALEAIAPLMTNPAQKFPGAAVLAEQLITLPTHSEVSALDQLRLVAWLTKS